MDDEDDEDDEDDVDDVDDEDNEHDEDDEDDVDDEDDEDNKDNEDNNCNDNESTEDDESTDDSSEETGWTYRELRQLLSYVNDVESDLKMQAHEETWSSWISSGYNQLGHYWNEIEKLISEDPILKAGFFIIYILIILRMISQ